MTCRICHRRLTRPESIRRGIGPVCGKKKIVQDELFSEDEMEALKKNDNHKSD